MVFESVISNLLNTYLNEFIDDLSVNQLKIGAFSGNVELNNLTIKGNAFESLNLPFKIVYGRIGKFKATVPWVSLYTSPVVFSVKEVFILCAPNTDCQYDEENEQKQREIQKRRQLQRIEEAMRRGDLADQSDNAVYDFVSRLIAQIVKNLEICIEDIHICYEDKLTNPKCPFSLGLTLKKLNFVTLENPSPRFSSAKRENCFEKDVSLYYLSFYWECSRDLRFISELSYEEDILALFYERIACETNEPSLAYILKPNSYAARTWILRKPKDDDIEIPMFDIDISLDQFSVKLNRRQMQSAQLLQDSLNRSKLAASFKKWRPSDKIAQNPRAWWKFAITAILEKRVRPKNRWWSWAYIKAHRKNMRDYKQAYTAYLKNDREINVEVVEELEKYLDVFNIILIRNAVEIELDQIETQSSVQTQPGGWFSWFFSDTSKKVDNISRSVPILEEFKKEMTPEEKTKLYQAIGYHESPTDQSQVEEYFVSITFTPINVSDSEQASAHSYSKPKEKDISSIAVNFKVPEFTLELIDDLENSKEQSLAKVFMKEFFMFYKKSEEFESEIKITLKSLVMEDLLVSASSNHRYLMSSNLCDKRKSDRSSVRKCDYFSSSCPSSPRELKYLRLTPCTSLPSKLQCANIYQLMPFSNYRKPRNNLYSSFASSLKIANTHASSVHRRNSDVLPTPPPSPNLEFSDQDDQNETCCNNFENYQSHSDNDSTLVEMVIKFIDDNSPHFATKYNRNHRIVTIKFNSLETTINPETWAKILNFFDPMPEKKSRYENSFISLSDFQNLVTEKLASGKASQLIMDSKVDLTVRRLSIILNKPEDKPLAKANILGLSFFFSKNDNNVFIEGKLKKLYIFDLTKYNKIYKERFVTTGEEALHFEFFRFLHDDDNLKREYDMSLKLQMASVQYVHSHRFYSEVMEFLKHFNALQNRIRALSAPELLLTLRPSTRISVHIRAAAPVIVIPVHHLCESVLVADFGQLTANNKFLYAGSSGTIGTVCKKSGLSQSNLLAAAIRSNYGVVTRVSSQSLVSRYVRMLEPKPCLLDVLNVQLTEMDLYSGVVSPKGRQRLLDPADTALDFPSFFVKRLPGKILKEKFVFNLQIERNLESEFNHSSPDISILGKVSAVHCTLHSPLYQLVRGILDNNLGEPLDQVQFAQSEADGKGLSVLLPKKEWTSLALHLDLKDVSLEVVDRHHCTSKEDTTLTRIDFLSSRLSIEIFTDSSKDIDLVSQEIRVTDTRYLNFPPEKRPNIFPDILQPAKKGLPSTPLQLEIHYRSKKDQVCLTILLNNMRVTAIFDWFKEISDFLSQPISFKKSQDTRSHNDKLNRSVKLSMEDEQPDFELKFNITDTELVVVENCGISNTNAVILKGTAILSLATDLTHPEPFNCTLQGFELFSCILGVEKKVARSIVDPLNVTIDLAPKSIPHSSLSEESQEVVLVLDISKISLHLSFQDILLFSKILHSLPTQTKVLSNFSDYSAENMSLELLNSSYAPPQVITQLEGMGFRRSDCIQALDSCKGDINEAAIWLSHNLLDPSCDNSIKKGNRFSKFNFQVLCLQIHACIITLIDDCKDTQVSLFEIRFDDVELWQRLGSKVAGSAKFVVAADHFDRNLFGWQPLVEKWQCGAEWTIHVDEQDASKKVSCSINSLEKLSIVIINSCLRQYRNVLQSWMDEYERQTPKDCKAEQYQSPLIPFAIKKEGGYGIRFYRVNTNAPKMESNFLIKLSHIEVSLVNEFCEEIICLHLFEIVLEYQYMIFEHRLNCSVRYIQADNQLMDAEKPVIFYTMDLDDANPNAGMPAISIFMHKLIIPKLDASLAHFFEDVQIVIKDICLNLEEHLVLKAYELAGFPKSENSYNDENTKIKNRDSASALSKSARFYFSNLRIKLDNVKLSVVTTTHLTPKLNKIKKELGLRLVRFEDAKIVLVPFRKSYSLETLPLLTNAVIKHYHQQLKGQAAKILGSVDFLGNPLGFVNDVSDGISELINEGNVGGLILNLTHGISDSTAKFTLALSDGLGIVGMDDRHQEMRKRIKTETNDHLKAGVKAFAVGILGGATSILTQTYEGAVNKGGMQGFMSGLGKGLLGTITKPAVGMLDFASRAATAVRDTSRKMVKDSWPQEKRIRPPRPRFSIHGPGSPLPHYSYEQAVAQEFFYKSAIINERDDDELFISFKIMRPNAVVFISTHRVHFLTWSDSNLNERGRGQISISFQYLIRCEMLTQLANTNHQSSSSSLIYSIVLVVIDENCLHCHGNYHKLADLGSKKPKIRCHSELTAKETMQYINSAKASFQKINYNISFRND